MITKAEEFILDIRRAARMEQKPTVVTDSQLIDPDTTARALQRSAMWLTPKVVDTYDPAAFEPWSGELQEELRQAIDGFRSVAGPISPDKPTNASQLRIAVQAFDQLKAVVQKVVWAEWERAAQGLAKQVEDWVVDLKGISRRERKILNETLIGEYQLDQLYMHVEGNLYILDPLARFIPGGLGAFDLSIQPSFYVTSIYRNVDGIWYVHLDVGQGVHGAKKEPLTQESFKRALVELRSLL